MANKTTKKNSRGIKMKWCCYTSIVITTLSFIIFIYTITNLEESKIPNTELKNYVKTHSTTTLDTMCTTTYEVPISDDFCGSSLDDNIFVTLKTIRNVNNKIMTVIMKYNNPNCDQHMNLYYNINCPGIAYTTMFGTKPSFTNLSFLVLLIIVCCINFTIWYTIMNWLAKKSQFDMCDCCESKPTELTNTELTTFTPTPTPIHSPILTTTNLHSIKEEDSDVELGFFEHISNSNKYQLVDTNVH